MNRPLLPLTALFATLLEGCLFTCPKPREETEEFTFTDEELDAFIADVEATGDTFDGCLDVCNFNAVLDGDVTCESTRDDEAGTTTFTCTGLSVCVGGRMHAVVAPRQAEPEPDPTRAWLAQAAHDEAASVHAFVALAEELRQHGAPRDLVGEILAAAEDEVRHARTLRALARGAGARSVEPETRDLEPRSIEAIALENAAEALVVETWNALVAAWQARHAGDLGVREAMVGIADDEARHAELGRRIDAWLRSRLDADARDRVDAARRAAVADLRGRVRASAAVPALGLPDAETALRWVDALEHAGVW